MEKVKRLSGWQKDISDQKGTKGKQEDKKSGCWEELSDVWREASRSTVTRKKCIVHDV